MRKRWLVTGLAALVAVGVIGAGAVSMAGQAQREHVGAGHAVATKGRTTFEPNSNIASTLRFGTDRIVVNSGDQVRWVHRDEDPDPHTITIVKPGEVPESIGEVFAGCASCDQAGEGHFGGGGLVRKVEDDDDGEVGLDGPGDSLWLDPGSRVVRVVSAPSGTRLRYLCIIHPWMIGTIKVA
jgi:plastocyanin